MLYLNILNIMSNIGVKIDGLLHEKIKFKICQNGRFDTCCFLFYSNLSNFVLLHFFQSQTLQGECSHVKMICESFKPFNRLIPNISSWKCFFSIRT